MLPLLTKLLLKNVGNHLLSLGIEIEDMSTTVIDNTIFVNESLHLASTQGFGLAPSTTTTSTTSIASDFLLINNGQKRDDCQQHHVTFDKQLDEHVNVGLRPPRQKYDIVDHS